MSTGSRRRMPNSGSPRLSIRLVEFRISAKSIVRCLRSPPLLLSDRRMRREESFASNGASAAPHCPQKWLVDPLTCLQASHLIRRREPHRSQYSLPALFSLPHCEHCILSSPGAETATNLNESGSRCSHSITSSARASRVGGTVRPSALAVFRLITSSYLVGACTGRFAGFSSLKIRST
jgi:hypothetical protein